MAIDRRLRLTTLLRISILYCASVALSGRWLIGLAPHIVAMLSAKTICFYLPASALIGALVLSPGLISIRENLIPGPNFRWDRHPGRVPFLSIIYVMGQV